MNTNNWKLDLFSSLDSADSLQSVMSAALNAIQPFGFDFCGWRADLPTADCAKESGITVLNAVEDEVYNTTVNGGYQNAPIPFHCAHSLTPVSWQGTVDDEIFIRSREVAEEYFSLGHRGGWAIATTGSDGDRGMFFIESQHIIPSADLLYAEQHMQWVSAATYMRITELKSTTEISLSRTESEIIKELFKTNGNIFQTADNSKLTLKQVTINIESMMKKFECNNIHSLLARAIFLGFID